MGRNIFCCALLCACSAILTFNSQAGILYAENVKKSLDVPAAQKEKSPRKTTAAERERAAGSPAAAQAGVSSDAPDVVNALLFGAARGEGLSSEDYARREGARKAQEAKEAAMLQAIKEQEDAVPLFKGGARATGKKFIRADAEERSLSGMFLTTLFWLVVIVALIGGVVYALKKYLPNSRLVFGSGKIDVIERKYLDSKKSLFLVKVGRRVLVLGAVGDSVRCLSEITDTVEAEELMGKRFAEQPSRGEEKKKSAFNTLLDKETGSFGDEPEIFVVDEENHVTRLEKENKKLRDSIRRLDRSK